MMKIKNSITFLVIFICQFIASTNAANLKEIDKEKRIALVIGNSQYEFAPLKNPTNDAKDIAKTLSKLGFQVIEGLNLNHDQIQEKIEEFSIELKKADVAMFYFAGHGFQIDGKNFLMPLVDTPDDSEDIQKILSKKSISTDKLLRLMDEAGNAINIVILDACRDNPFPDDFKVNSPGLANLKDPIRSLIAYATAPGKRAADGTGENGLYTQHLLRQIVKPGVSIEYFFKQVRHGVISESGGTQVPWENSSLIDEFYFIEPENPFAEKMVIQPADKDKQIELEFWKSIQGIESDLLYKAYLEKYPDGNFAIVAKTKLAKNNSAIAIKSQSQLASTEIDRQVTVNMKNITRPVEKLPPEFIPPTPLVLNKQTLTQQKSSNSIVNEIEMIKVTKGCFVMGSPFGEEGRQSDELDHEVCLTSDYWLSTTEITQSLWKKIMGRNPSYFKSCGSNCPVERVSWNDAQIFIERLNKQTGFNYRLPTEAEWEYAARANTQSATYKGDIEWLGENNAPEIDSIAWYSGNSAVAYKGGKFCDDWEDKQIESIRCGIQPIATKKPNLWGLYDMIGNVRELTQDRYGHYSSKENINPKGAKKGKLRVARGGDWSSSLDHNRSAARYGFAENERSITLGLRLAR